MKNKALSLLVLTALVLSGVWVYLGKPVPKAVPKQNYEGNPFVMTVEEQDQYYATERQAKEKIIATAKRCDDSPYAFYKVGELVFKVSRKELRLANLDNSRVDKAEACSSTQKKPALADLIIIDHKIAMRNGTNLLVHVSVSNLKHENTYLAIKEKLSSQDKTFSDLPIESGFYKYSQTPQILHYIAQDSDLVDFLGYPIIHTTLGEMKNARGPNTVLYIDETTTAAFRIGSADGEVDHSRQVSERFKEVLPLYKDYVRKIIINN